VANVFLLKPFSDEETRALESADPRPVYAELAGRCPVHRGPDGTPTLMRMGDVVAANRRRDVLGPGANGPMMGGQRPLIPLDLDGAEHARYRRLLDPLFSARRVALLEPALRALADELIDAFVDEPAGTPDRPVDLYDAFCQPLPSRFFLRLMGIPAGDLAEFISFKNAILGHLPPGLTLVERMAAVRDASRRCYSYFGALLDEREARGEPGDDLMGWLIAAEVDGARLSREDILDIAYLLIIAGLDTVTASLGCMIAHLARTPELRRRLVERPELWADAVEELLRVESPVQTGFRTATADLAIAGESIAAGTTFFLCWASANLDPETFADPLAVDIERRPNPHVAFGSGPHRCLGLNLARMELRVALEQLHRRIPEYSLAEGHPLAFAGKPRTANALPVVWRR
jgi:cytochrome P450